MIEKDYLLYFESDDEFADFCVAPYAEIVMLEDGTLTYRGNYSEMYLNSLQEDRSFVIKDKNSKVYKRRCVCKRVPIMMDGVVSDSMCLVQLKVRNMIDYFEIKLLEDEILEENLSSEDIDKRFQLIKNL